MKPAGHDTCDAGASCHVITVHMPVQRLWLARGSLRPRHARMIRLKAVVDLHSHIPVSRASCLMTWVLLAGRNDEYEPVRGLR